MAPVPRASAFPHSVSDAADLDAQVDQVLGQLGLALQRAAITEPVCSLCFIFCEAGVYDEDLPLATSVSALTLRERDAALAADPERGLWTVWHWNPHQHPDFFDDLRDEFDTLSIERAERLSAALTAAGCKDVQGAFVCELAYRAARAQWPDITVTDDFACWATEHEFCDDVFDTFRVTAAPAPVAAYEARGWMRVPEPTGKAAAVRGINRR